MSVLQPYYDREGVTLYHGDCIEVMRTLPEASVDAIVTDPPYGLEFMGKDWDAPWKVGSNVTRDAGFHEVELADGAARLPRPSYNGSSNPFCRNCGGRQRGNDRKDFHRCRCAAPDFPNVRAIEGRAFQAWCEEWGREALRVLKPGGHLVAFGGPRTYHRMACAIEDAGFELRDSLIWLFGSGFPKSLNVSKAIESHLLHGGSNTRRLRQTEQDGGGVPYLLNGRNNGIMGEDKTWERKTFEPSMADARRWDGWGTALKPAYEPIVLARKPLIGTTAGNVLAHGTGALNIDGTRIDGDAGDGHWSGDDGSDATSRSGYEGGFTCGGERASGRWPANVLLDEAAAAMLDAQTGDTGAAGRASGPSLEGNYDGSVAYGARLGTDAPPPFYGDRGGPSRFFFVSRGQEWSRDVRVVSDAGIQCGSCGTVTALSPAPVSLRPDRQVTRGQDSIENSAASTQAPSPVSSAGPPDDIDTIPTTPNFCGSCGSALPAIDALTNSGNEGRVEAGSVPALATRFHYGSKASRSEREAGVDVEPTRRSDGRAKDIENPRLRTNERRNDHPTVKPLDLMRWLCRLVTPPGGLILDPFLGSGTTALAALDEGFRCWGIERERRYLEISEDRVVHRHLLELRAVEPSAAALNGRLL